jgi:Radical SAM superfamily
MRGCPRRCPYCVVPIKEGPPRPEQTIAQIWRGTPWTRRVILLDNDFFAQREWRKRVAELRDGRFRGCLTQGINLRSLTDETAEAIASLDCRNASMKTRRIYAAWDNPADRNRIVAGLKRLTRYGVRPDSIMVYFLIGYWPNETHADREYRRRSLLDFSVRPYPMPFRRTPELIGYQRWVVRRADLTCSWEAFQNARYRPERVAAPFLPGGRTAAPPAPSAWQASASLRDDRSLLPDSCAEDICQPA